MPLMWLCRRLGHTRPNISLCSTRHPHRKTHHMPHHSTPLVLLDGGVGEELLAHRGVPDDRMTWSAKAVSDPAYHETLRAVHVDFLAAGSTFTTVNNFGVTPGVFGTDHELIRKLTRLAGEIARKAVATSPHGSSRVLASLPPLVESYRPDLAMRDHALAVKYYRSLVIEPLDDLVDGWIAETLSSSAEVVDAMDAVSEHVLRRDATPSLRGRRDLFVSMCVKDGGLVRSGETATEAVRRVVEHWVATGHDTTRDASVRLVAVLFNCSTPKAISMALDELAGDEQLLALLDAHSVKLGAYPNRLTEIPDDWALASSTEPQETRKDFDEAAFVAWAVDVMERHPRVQYVGGCCGIRPSFIRALRARLGSDAIPQSAY